MTSLTVKTIAGHRYYYARECKRINGKPKIVWQKYLGKLDDIIAAMTGPAPGVPQPKDALVVEFGASAALLRISERLDLVRIIDEVCPKRRQGLSVGSYLTLAAINRCVCPKSKATFADWYDDTVLRRLFPVPKEALASQRFWDHMDRIDEAAICLIEEKLATRAVAEFGITLDHLLYDSTNFFTFIDSFNDESTLAQRGHSKEGRASLRLIGLALLVSRDSHIPLVHATYPGNRPDATQFGSTCEQLMKRIRMLAGENTSVTLVFDKGQTSKDNLERLGEMHFVSSVPASMVKDLIDLKHDDPRFQPASHPGLKGVRTMRLQRDVFGARRTVLVTVNLKLRDAQRESLRRALEKALVKLSNLATKLQEHQAGRGRSPSLDSVAKSVQSFLKVQHLRTLVETEIREENGRPLLKFSIRAGALDELASTRLGKTILFTSRDEWTDEEIVLGYRGQYQVEDAFRTMKDPTHVSFAPLHHWTDQKIRVHVLYCVIALMLASLLAREAAKANIHASIANIIEELSHIHEVTTFYPPVGPKGRALRTATVLSRLNPEQQILFDSLGLGDVLGHTTRE